MVAERPSLIVSSLAGLAVVLVSGMLGWVAVSTTNMKTELAVVRSQLETVVDRRQDQFNDLDDQLNSLWPLVRALERDLLLLKRPNN